MLKRQAQFILHSLGLILSRPLVMAVLCVAMSAQVFAMVVQNSSEGINSPQQSAQKNTQQAAFGEVVYHYFQEDFHQVLQLIEVGVKTHEFSALDAEDQDRLSLMQGAAQLNIGLYSQSQVIFAALLSQTNSAYVQANTWFFMAKAGFDNKQSDLSERAYQAIDKGDLVEHLSAAQWHELLYMGAFTRMQSDINNTSGINSDWQSLFKQIPKNSIYNTYLLANYASNLFNAGDYEQAILVFSSAKQALLVHQNSQTPRGELSRSLFEPLKRVFTPWRWFDENAHAEQLQKQRKISQEQAELNALFDTINLGLGQSLLQQGDLNSAIAVLQNVSKEGVASEQAILSYGWASARENRWQQAMGAWQHLQNNSVGLLALQASYGLAYAFGQQDNLGQAFFALQSTSQQISDSLVILNSFTQIAQQHDFFNRYNEQWPQSLSDLKLSFFSPTLTFDAKYLLSIREQAQVVLKDISDKQARLIQLEQLLLERASTYQDRLQSVSLAQAQTSLTQAQGNIDVLRNLIQQSNTFEQQLALSKKMASPETGTHIERIDKAAQRLQRLQTNSGAKRPLKASYETRLKRLEGIIAYDLMNNYVAQQWQHQQLLKQAQLHQQHAQKQYQKLQQLVRQQSAFGSEQGEIERLKQGLNAQSQYAQKLYNRATKALTARLVTLVNERQEQLKQQSIKTRLAMLRIQDLQQGGQ